MATGKALNGKPYAGNPHIRFDEGEVAPAATPRRGSLLYKKAVTVALGAICSTGVMGEVLSTQDLSLKPGWNAVYAEVSPTGTLDSVFESWPTDSVGLYDPGAFLSTAQFAAEGETQGMTAPPFATWKRGYPEASDAKRLPAGTVLLYFGTNASPVATTLVGVPAAPRLKWHVSGTNNVYNYVGFSLARGAGVTTAPSDYLDGFGGAYLSNRTFYRIFGTSKAEAPRMIKVTSTKVADGDVLIMPSDIVSDWSGVLWVSPRSGLDYGRDDVKRTLTIRNDGTKPRTVSIDLVDDAANRQDVTLAYTWLHVRDAGAALTNAQWTACTDAHVAAKTLAAGETWNLQVGLDRKAMNGYPAGKSFGLILRITETEGYSKMRVDVPIQGETSGGAASARAWPGGLWVGDVALDKVKGPGDGSASDAGSTLKLRLPLHIDENGVVRLLQRVVAAGTVGDDGYWDYILYAGTATPPATVRTVMRISAVCLPTETPVVTAKESNLARGTATFEFTVAGDGATSLLRHPYHPQHDGLKWDFKTAAPSGDDFANYKYDVKPETFSVKSVVALSLDFDGGEASWNPTDEVHGTCTWTLTGLRHEGAVTVSGPMTIKRVSPKTEIVLE